MLNMTRMAALAACLTIVSTAQAEVQRLQNDFTFRRIGVPAAGTTNRITVQIDPNSPHRVRPPVTPEAPDDAGETVTVAASGPASPAPVPAGSAPTGFEWFWEGVSPAMADSRPGRLADAVALLASAPEGMSMTRPRVQTLSDIAQAHGADILMATVGTDVSPALVLAVIAVESAGQADAVSSAGAQGLMQLIPATAERFGVADSTIPAENIRGGVEYLDWLLNHFDGDPILALAGYNAGEGAVRDNAGVPPYAETRGYVPKVIAAWTVARGLCQTPPDLISDGCVFTVNNL
jgi:hypothetical protein